MHKNNNKIPIYFVPGLAASTQIFEYIDLPKDFFELHFLKWIVPLNNSESIESYAKRMCLTITHNEPILIGVSFGGVVVQEMSKQIKTKKVIIISSIKSRNELPKRLKLIQKTKAYKLFPTKSLNNIENLTKYVFGKTIKKRLELYNTYLSMRNELYLDWAIYNVLHWKQQTPMENIIHIHGNDDHIFPIKHIKKCHVINGGTHIMILNKSKKISAFIQSSLI